MRTIQARLGRDSYTISIGSGLLEQAGQQLAGTGLSGKLVIITNPVVKRLHGQSLAQSLSKSGFEVTTLEIPDGEEQKSLDTAGRLYHELANAYAERNTPVLALGGGVIGDLAGFVAATYQRGVPLVQIPTTLLAQVDSSIGGKVAVNHGRLKNNIGSFYQPKAVIADTGTLRTLSTREFNNGLAEAIKSAAIRDAGFFAFIEENMDNIKSLDKDTLEKVVFRTAQIKVGVVEQDEKDMGLRNILNYGHTAGHAIETASDFKISHGEAVAIGMLIAGRISCQFGEMQQSELDRLGTVIRRAGLPAAIPKLDKDKIFEAMRHDKKIVNGKARFVLLKKIGEAYITDQVGTNLVEEALAD